MRTKKIYFTLEVEVSYNEDKLTGNDVVELVNSEIEINIDISEYGKGEGLHIEKFETYNVEY